MREKQLMQKFLVIFSAEKRKKKALYLSVNVFSRKVLIGDTIFYVS